MDKCMELQIFNNPEFGAIRTAGTPEEPIFCASDICRALGYNNGRDAVSRHCDEGDVVKRDTPTSSGTQLMTFVNESGMYALIFGSKLEAAKQFKRWVTSEVLPTIRKHGAYATAETVEDLIKNPENGIRLLEALHEERQRRKHEQQQRMEAEEMVTKLEEQAIENHPKVVYADAVAGSMSSCLIGELAKMISQNGVPIGEKRLYQYLRDNHYLCSYGERYNLPYQKYIEQGLFTLKQNIFSANGELRTRNTTKVTGKGQVYFVNKFIGNKLKE